MLLQTKWKSQLDPILSDPISNGNILPQIFLSNGATVINHLLGRMLQGFFIVDINAPATIYRSAPKNALTLTLTSSASCIVDIFVY